MQVSRKPAAILCGLSALSGGSSEFEHAGFSASVVSVASVALAIIAAEISAPIAFRFSVPIKVLAPARAAIARTHARLSFVPAGGRDQSTLRLSFAVSLAATEIAPLRPCSSWSLSPTTMMSRPAGTSRSKTARCSVPPEADGRPTTSRPTKPSAIASRRLPRRKSVQQSLPAQTWHQCEWSGRGRAAAVETLVRLLAVQFDRFLVADRDAGDLAAPSFSQRVHCQPNSTDRPRVPICSSPNFCNAASGSPKFAAMRPGCRDSFRRRIASLATPSRSASSPPSPSWVYRSDWRVRSVCAGHCRRAAVKSEAVFVGLAVLHRSPLAPVFRFASAQVQAVIRCGTTLACGFANRARRAPPAAREVIGELMLIPFRSLTGEQPVVDGRKSGPNAGDVGRRQLDADESAVQLLCDR